MPQPYDYSLNVQSPTESFLGGIQLAQQLRQNKLAAEAQQAKLDAAAEAKQFSIDAAAAAKDPSGAALDALYEKYPTYGAELKALSERLDDKDKRTYGTFLKDAIYAKQRGASPEEISAIYKNAAETARNSGREDMAKNFDQAAWMATNKSTDDDFAAKSLLKFIDPKGYEIAYANEKEPFFTAGDKVYLRGPIMRLAKDTEALVSGQITEDQYDATWGKGKANQYKTTGVVDTIQYLAQPKTKEQFDKLPAGSEYIAPDGTTRRKPAAGGQTDASAPSGTFQGQ